MCGIGGYLGSAEFDPRPLFHALGHRGPDACGAWRTSLADGRSLHFVHTRLKILDLTDAAAQPMLYRGSASSGPTVRSSDSPTVQPPESPGNADLALTFNGEIYNFRELRAELEARGHAFRSSGDTEVFLRGYAEWGTAVFAKCDGMFACAIHDRRRQTLVLARDHAGIKPLYWARTVDGGLVFASEVRAIAASGLCPVEIDRVAVVDFLRLGSFQEPATVYAGIRALPAAAFAEIPLDASQSSTFNSQLSVTPYWSLDHFVGKPGRSDFSREELLASHRDILRATVHDQLASDVPVGLFLSGGLDSTVLVEQMRGEDRERLTAFTLGGEATSNDEAGIAARTAANLGVRHVLVRPESGELARWVADGLAAMDQPSCDGINTYLVSRASRAARLVVVLSGCGADELHGAYGHAASLSRFVRLFAAAGPFRDAGGRIASTLLSHWQGKIAGERLRLMVAAVPDVTQVVAEKRRFFTPSEVADMWPSAPAPTAERDEIGRGANGVDAIDTPSLVTLAELRGYLRNTLLRDSDWATMANHQELRVPYLGRRYTEHVVGLPWSMKHPANLAGKPLLAGLVSASNRDLLALPKRGFALNYGELLLGRMREPFHAACAQLRDDLGFTLDAAALLADHAVLRSTKRANRLWALLALGHYLAAARAARASSGLGTATP